MTASNAETRAVELDEFDNHNETDRIAYRAAAELRRLSAENVAAVSSFLSADEERIRLRAERDALVADAERYRWLREHGFAFADVSLGTDYEGKDYVTYRVGFHLPEPAHNRYEDDEWSAEDIDAAIDAARAAMKGTQ